MKIIKPGKKSFIATCRVCGCKFEYTIDELTASNCVYCPECGRYVYHEDQPNACEIVEKTDESGIGK